MGDRAVQTCVFKLEFSHNPNEAEQVGIDFVTTTKKQTNIKLSGADKDLVAKKMYYYMVLVLDPGFSAKEIRTAKTANLKRGPKPCGPKKGQKTKTPKTARVQRRGEYEKFLN
jgi:hypothetical protein